MILLGGVLLFFICKCMNALQKERQEHADNVRFPSEENHGDDMVHSLHFSPFLEKIWSLLALCLSMIVSDFRIAYFLLRSYLHVILYFASLCR